MKSLCASRQLPIEDMLLRSTPYLWHWIGRVESPGLGILNKEALQSAVSAQGTSNPSATCLPKDIKNQIKPHTAGVKHAQLQPRSSAENS